VLSRSQPAAVLAAAHMPGGGRKARLLREGLVAFQFAVATTLIAGAGVVVAQTSYLRRADIGFKRDGLIVVRSIDDKALTDAQRVDLIARWKALPGVVDAALSTAAPGEDEDIDATEVWRSGAAGPGRNVNYVDASSGFLHTYGARLIAGRGPDPASPGVAAPPSPVGVLNAGAVSRLGFTDAHAAIGQALHLNSERSQPLTIVGVVDDIRFHSPRAPVPPTLYRLTSGPIRNPSAAVRYGGQDARVVLGEMAQVWRQVAPTVPFRARTGKDSLQDLYRSDDQHDRLFVMGAILTVWIGCLGLYGLASFTITQRAREIGIRKALGASTADILGLVIAQFLRPVLLANLIAWPLAWLAMRSWLSGFDERIALSPAYLLMATVLTLAVALAAVVSQAYRVARANPAKTLRYE
ncbi:MAG: FtsX-like permease family protein, partial [Caulobacteraceae bacterium]